MSLRTSHRFAFALAGLWVFAAAATLRADSDENADQAKQEFSKIWNVEQLMDRAAENISRRYNLNEAQRKQTHDMLVKEVTKFLDEHEDIWPLVRDLARFQQMGKQPDGKIAQRLAQKALPLLREVEDSILDANERWRDILTDDQKRMQDYDLEDMARTFAQMNDNYREMAGGQGGVPELWPAPNPGANSVPKPTKPSKGYVPPPIPEVRQTFSEGAWDRYVREFIGDFQLDDSQSEAAFSILNECKQRAKDYRQSKRHEFAQVEEQLLSANQQDLSPEARKAKTRVWYQIQNTLNKPLLDLFQELKTRLDVIPSDTQRTAAIKAGRPLALERRSRLTHRNESAKTTDTKDVKTESAAEKPATKDSSEKPKAPESHKNTAKTKRAKAPVKTQTKTETKPAKETPKKDIPDE